MHTALAGGADANCPEKNDRIKFPKISEQDGFGWWGLSGGSRLSLLVGRVINPAGSRSQVEAAGEPWCGRRGRGTGAQWWVCRKAPPPRGRI